MKETKKTALIGRDMFAVNRPMIAGTLIGAALFTLMSYYVALPTPVAGTYFFPSYALLGLFAALLGPITGAFISLAGMVLVGLWRAGFDITQWINNYFFPGYIIASIAAGFIFGFAKNYVRAGRGVFGYRDIIAFNTIQIVGNFIAWVFLAPVLELVLNPGRPASTIFLQGLIATFVNIICMEFIGTVILLAYAGIRKWQQANRGKRPEEN